MLDTIKIKINGIDYMVKKSYRALMMFEQETGRSVDQLKENVSDLLKMFYCILKAANQETFQYTFDQFVDVLDETPDAVDTFSKFMVDQAKKVQTTQPKKK